MTFLLAIIIGVLGAAPILLSKRFGTTAIVAAVYAILTGLMIYLCLPSLVWPLWGVIGVFTVIAWLISAIIHYIIHEVETRSYETTGRVSPIPVVIFGLGLFALIGRSCTGCEAFRAQEYASLIGPMEQREWTQDIQPANPKHIRLVPPEMAGWLADKQLGSAPGAIGSQFEIKDETMTLQMVKGELWYVAPLDFKDFGTWQSTKVAPGYVMVHAEDPLRPVVVKTDEHYAYMPGAYFGEDLERYMWSNGYASSGMTDFSFELDEAGKAWWVITVFEPTIAYSGEKVLGVAIVDPVNGAIDFHPMDKVPDWVDRVVPRSFAKMYARDWGDLLGGWVNSWWGEQNLTRPEDVEILYGSDGQPDWAIGMTSQNSRDSSLVRLIYMNSRTGKAVSYHAKGGTESAVLAAVNNKVSYRKWHGSGPVLYNLYGHMVSVVPLLGENHTYQGVAIVSVDNLQVAVGENQQQALREFQKIMNESGQQIVAEAAHAVKSLELKIDRFAVEMQSGDPTYYIHLEGIPHIFTGGNTLSEKLRLTQVGDLVRVTYEDSGESVMPLTAFDNCSLEIEKSKAEGDLHTRVEERKEKVEAERAGPTMREKLNQLPDEELQRLMQLRSQDAGPGDK